MTDASPYLSSPQNPNPLGVGVSSSLPSVHTPPPHFFQNKLIAGLTLLLLLVGISTGLYLGQQNQELRQRAFDPYDTCISGHPDCIGGGAGTTCGGNGQCGISELSGNCWCQPPDGPTCDECVLPDQSCPSGQQPNGGQQCVVATTPLGDLYGTCCVATDVNQCSNSSPTASACQGVNVGDQCTNFSGICTQTGADSNGTICACNAFSPTPGNGTAPTNTPGSPTLPPNPTAPPATPVPTAPAGISQGTIRICKAILRNGQMVNDWNTIPETRFRVQFDKKPTLRNVASENNIPSSYGTKSVETITFKSAAPISLKTRPNLNNVVADCQDLVIEYNDNDRQDVTYMKEIIEQKDANGQWIAASGWDAPLYNDSILIKDINGQPNNVDTIPPTQIDQYDEALFNGSNDQTVIGRTKYTDGYVRINNSHNIVTLLMVNNLTTTTPTSTPVNGPVCLNVTLNNISDPENINPPNISDHVTLTCSQVSGADHYEFRMHQPNDTIVTIPASINTRNISQDFTITMMGGHLAECRVCSSSDASSCSAWEFP